MQNYPSSANMTSGSNGTSSSWCWYYWCNSNETVPAQSNKPSNSPSQSPSEMLPSNPSSSSWCFYFWCDSSTNGTNPPRPSGIAKPPGNMTLVLPEMHYPPPIDSTNSSGTYPEDISFEEEFPARPPTNGQNTTSTHGQNTTSTNGQPGSPTGTISEVPSLPNTESFNATLMETFSNSSTSSFNQTNIINDSNNFLNVSNFSNATFSNFSLSSQVSNSSVYLYFPSGSTSFSSSNTSSQSSSSSSSSSTFTASSSYFSPLTPNPQPSSPTRFNFQSFPNVRLPNLLQMHLRPSPDKSHYLNPLTKLVPSINLNNIPPHIKLDQQHQDLSTPTNIPQNSPSNDHNYPSSTSYPHNPLQTSYNSYFQTYTSTIQNKTSPRSPQKNDTV